MLMNGSKDFVAQESHCSWDNISLMLERTVNALSEVSSLKQTYTGLGIIIRWDKSDIFYRSHN